MIVEFTYSCGVKQIKTQIKQGEYRYIIKPVKRFITALEVELKDKETSNKRKKKILSELLPPLKKDLEPYNMEWFTDKSPLGLASRTTMLKLPPQQGGVTRVGIKIIEE